jgi:peptidoglycan-N-acetylglucosamine deacetylase
MRKLSRRDVLASAGLAVAAPLLLSKPAAANPNAHNVEAGEITPVPMLPSSNRAAVWTSVPVNQPVVFITIDDGYHEDPTAADIVESRQIPVTPFLTYYAASSGSYPPSSDPAKVAHLNYLKRFLTKGHGVQSHSKTHCHLPQLTYEQQYSEIQKARDWLSRPDMFGNTPTLFRPPYGEYDENTLKALRQLGFPIALLWTHTPSSLSSGAELRPGDIILLHFTTTLSADLALVDERMNSAGLTPAYLSDYVR